MIAPVLGSCSTLQYFAWQPPLCATRNSEIPTTLSEDLHESLDIVATVPILHTLRLLWAPGAVGHRIRKLNPSLADQTAQDVQQLANLILRYLHQNGSNITLLAISPDLQTNQPAGDPNLHFYPHYLHRLRHIGLGGEQEFVAVAL